MSSWYDDLPQSERLQALVTAVEANPHILSVFSTGAWAHGTVDESSDLDLVVVLDRPDLSVWRNLQDRLEVTVVSLERLRDIPTDPSRWWDRYDYARARVLFDRSDGYVPKLLQAWGTLTEQESADAVDFSIDAYLTYTERSLECHAAGQSLAARLDGAEALPFALSLLFAVHGRVRPVNRYLAWELDHLPLPGENWTAQNVLDLVAAILDDGSAQAQREVFALLEPQLRRLGFGGVIDGFGLSLLRARP